MSETEKNNSYEAPPTAVTAHTITLNGESEAYRAESGWLTLHKHEKPAAEMFHVFYETEDPDRASRPSQFRSCYRSNPDLKLGYLTNV